MPRQARLDVPGTLYHVIIRGIEKRQIARKADPQGGHPLGRTQASVASYKGSSRKSGSTDHGAKDLTARQKREPLSSPSRTTLQAGNMHRAYKVQNLCVRAP